MTLTLLQGKNVENQVQNKNIAAQVKFLHFQDIEPIKQETDRNKFSDPDPLEHPDTDNANRYILGTRLQYKSGHRGHKRDICPYQDLDLSIQGSKIATMLQESMQNVRKWRSIQQDKMRRAFKNLICIHLAMKHLLHQVYI